MPRILIADDDEAFLYTIQAQLAERGYTVEIVLNAIEIFSMIDRFKPDLILLDTYLKNYDGRTIGRMLKLNPSTAKLPIILCSADPGIAHTSFHTAADRFCVKPCDIDQLVASIESLLPNSSSDRTTGKGRNKAS